MGSQRDSERSYSQKAKRKYNFGKNTKASKRGKKSKPSSSDTTSPKQSRSESQQRFTRSSAADDNGTKDESNVTSICDAAKFKPKGDDAYNSDSYGHNDRVCYCDRFEIPSDCKPCKTNPPCPLHELVQCSTEGCYKKCHKQCIIDSGKSVDGYKCLKCSSSSNISQVIWENASLQQQAERLGMMTPLNLYHEKYNENFESNPKDVQALKHKLKNVFVH